MVDEKTKQKILDRIKARQIFSAKTVARELNLSSHKVSHVFSMMKKEGLIKRWNRKQWIWEETCLEKKAKKPVDRQI